MDTEPGAFGTDSLLYTLDYLLHLIILRLDLSDPV